MKAIPVRQNMENRAWEPCEPRDATNIWIHLPGPTGKIMLPVVHGNATRSGTGCWSWNGDTEKVTLKPSLLTKGHYHLTDDEYERILAGGKVSPKPFRCHVWITDGKVQFLNDSDHKFAGQTIDLLDVEP